MKYNYLILLFILLFAQNLFAQKKEVNNALKKGRASNMFYTCEIKDGKVVLQDDLNKYAIKNNLIIRDVKLQEVNRFGDKCTAVKSFYFLPISEIPSYVFSRDLNNNLTNLSYDNLVNSKRGKAYVFNPIGNYFPMYDVYWTGNLNGSNITGNGVGLVILSGNTSMILFKGNFVNGILEGGGQFNQVVFNELLKVNTIKKVTIVKLSSFSDGLASFEQNNLYGFVDDKLNIVISPKYKSVSKGFLNGKAIVYRDNEEIIIDKKGNFIDYSIGQKNIFEEKRKLEEKARVAELERLRQLEINDKINITNDFNFIKNSNDKFILYKFYLKHANSKYDFAREFAKIAYDNAAIVDSKNVEEYNDALNFNSGKTLVKIIIKNKKLAFPYVEEVKNYLENRYSYIITLFGNERDEKLFYGTKAVAYGNKMVINSYWYRAGTKKDGDIYTQNSGFPKFISDFTYYANTLGFQVEYIEYLGSFEDDIARDRSRQLAYENYKAEECLKCTVDVKKTEVPKETSLWGLGILTSLDYGKIVMKNGESYSWSYSDKGYYAPGFLVNDYFKTYDEMISSFVSRCMEKKCR